MAKGEWIAKSLNCQDECSRLVYYEDGKSAEEVILYKGRSSFNTHLRAYRVGDAYLGNEVLLPWEFLK